MNITADELKNAIHTYANAIGLSESVDLLIANVGIASTIKELIYYAFVKGHDATTINCKAFMALNQIQNYCSELMETDLLNLNKIL